MTRTHGQTATPADRTTDEPPPHLVRRRRIHGLPEHACPTGWIAGQQITRREQHGFTTLIALRLDPADYVIMGTGALIAYGLPRQINDLDVLVRGDAWDKVWGHPDAEHGIGSVSGDKVVRFDNGLLEFCENWIDGATTDDLIARAEILRYEDWGPGRTIRFAALADSIRYKLLLQRPKDRADLKAIEPNLPPTSRHLPGQHPHRHGDDPQHP